MNACERLFVEENGKIHSHNLHNTRYCIKCGQDRIAVYRYRSRNFLARDSYRVLGPFEDLLAKLALAGSALLPAHGKTHGQTAK